MEKGVNELTEKGVSELVQKGIRDATVKKRYIEGNNMFSTTCVFERIGIWFLLGLRLLNHACLKLTFVCV